MLLGDLFNLCKRDAGLGQAGVTNDQVTTDMVSAFNLRAMFFWKKWPWTWSVQFKQITIQPALTGLPTFTFDDTVGDIILLSPPGGPPLERITPRRFEDWEDSQTITQGAIQKYMNTGRAVNPVTGLSDLTFQFWPNPQAAAIINAYLKTLFTPVAVADVANNIVIPYFPPDVHYILRELLLSDCYNLAKDARGPGALAQAMAMITDLQGIENDPQDEQPSNPQSDYVIFSRRNRSGGSSNTPGRGTSVS